MADNIETSINLEEGLICIRLLSSSYCSDPEILDRYIHEYKGDVVFRDFECREIVVGNFIAAVADLDSMHQNNIGLFDAFDQEAEHLDYLDAVSDDEHQIKREVGKALGNEYFFPSNILMLKKVFIDRAFRGRSFGLLAINTLIDRLRYSQGIVILKAFPLQFDCEFEDGDQRERFIKMGLDQFTLSEEKAEAKLFRYYRKLGFKKLRGSNYMVRGSMEDLTII